MAAAIHLRPTRLMTHLNLYRETHEEILGSPSAGGVFALFFVHPGNEKADVPAQVAKRLALHLVGAGLDYPFNEERMVIYEHAQECIAKIRSVQATMLCDRFLLSFNAVGLVRHEKSLNAIRGFAEKVMPTIEWM